MSKAAEAVVHRPDDRRAPPRRFENRLEEIRGGGLAVGAGHAGEYQAVGDREPARRDQPERPARIAHGHPRSGLGLEPVGRSPLGHHRHRAAGQSLADELPPVGTRARNRHEQIAGLHQARVVANLPDREVSHPVQKPGIRHPRNQLTKDGHVVLALLCV